MAAPRNPLTALKEKLQGQNPCAAHPPIHRSTSPEEAALFHESFQHCNETARREHLRWMALNDLYYLGAFILHRVWWYGEGPRLKNATPEHKERVKQWYFNRCQEVQDSPNGHLDIWSRESAKSEILSFALIIQDVLRNSDETVGIFSHTRPMAKGFLRVIKTEFETNTELIDLFPDVLYRDPQSDSPKWSQDEGIIVKRKYNAKESTIEAWGLVDGQPTGKRFTILHYDDVVARDQISEDMIRKTTEELENSYFLTASDPPIRRIIGTPQEIGDTICNLEQSGKFPVRKRVAVDENGKSLFHSEEKLADFKNSMSPKVFALQVLLDPKKAQDARDIGFESEWFQVYKTPRNMKSLNRYILVDPAGKAKDSNSFFAAWVVGLGGDHCVYILDGILDSLGLTSRTDKLFALVRQWEPLKVVYEKFAYQSDIEHYQEKMDAENCRFTIVPVGGQMMSKDQRIERLMPWFRAGRIIFPERLMYRNGEGTEIDIVKRFKEVEFAKWPFNPNCRDQLDALARLCDNADVNYVYPRNYGAGDAGGDHWRTDLDLGGGSWLSS